MRSSRFSLLNPERAAVTGCPAGYSFLYDNAVLLRDTIKETSQSRMKWTGHGREKDVQGFGGKR